MRPNIRVEIQNNLVEAMDVDENEEGEISDNDAKETPETQLEKLEPDQSVYKVRFNLVWAPNRSVVDIACVCWCGVASYVMFEMFQHIHGLFAKMQKFTFGFDVETALVIDYLTTWCYRN